jgi:MoaA/NifB/PqqE/SkfB family radical SAM enzyme
MTRSLPALAATAASIVRHPEILRVRPAVSLPLLGYTRKFRPRRVGGNVVVHSHLPPLNSRAYGRYVREHLLGKSLKPSHAQIGLTDACPQRCAYCYNKGRTGERLDKAAILRSIAELRELGVFWLGLTGGEPLLNKDIVDITAAASRDCAVKLFTTGCGLTPDLAAALRKAGLFSASVSLDHGTAAVHDAIRGYPGAFDAALRAIDIFKAAGIHTGVSAVLSADLVRRGQVESFLDFLESLGLHEAWLSEMKPSIRDDDGGAGLLTAEERAGLVRLQDDRNRRGGMTINYLAHFEGPANFGCNAGTRMIYVDAFGEVSPCVFAAMSFGNVRRRPLAEIWREMSASFAPGSECFVIRNHRLLRSRAGDGIPLPPETSRDLMRGVAFSSPGRFVGLLGREEKRTR